MDSGDSPVETIYQRRARTFAAAEQRCERQDRVMPRVRFALFVIAVAAIALAWKTEQARLGYWGGGVALAGFFAAVVYHDQVRRRLERNRLLRQINQQAIARLHRDWVGLPDTPVAVPPEHQAVAGDLDLFGRASLFHWICSAGTPVGIRVLRDWLLAPARPDEIKRRQQAVAELAPHLELRETLILEGRLLADRGRATERLTEWAEGPAWLAARPWLLWPVRATAATALLLLLLPWFRVVPMEFIALALFAVILLNVLITVLFGGTVHEIFSLVNLRRGEVARYLRLFQLMESMPQSSSELGELKREAMSLGGGVLVRLRQLNRIALLAMVHRSALLFVFIYLPLQLLFLYDFHVLNLLEAWQIRYGRFVRGWFLALGKFEALASLARIAHDDPGWAMPRVTESADRFQATGLGHPLLPDVVRVANDVEIGPAGSFLLVTGSNMSGKSTLLRAVGLNAVLAQAGAPVCAESLVMPPVMLATSMRIRDSLVDGVSFYMAELMRLKQIVDIARGIQPADDRLLLYLLDEILLGTNSRERHLAVMRVLEHLLQCGAIGAISTHDLELATSEPLAGACRCVHFAETLHDADAERPMTFDYKLRPGVATTTNALKLLEIVGLDRPGPVHQIHEPSITPDSQS